MSGNFTLENFYKSNQWHELTQKIKLERISPEGQLICDHCGKPIVKAYDCICHHKIALTPGNVNDYLISLNPENISLVHHRCHNEIHNKLGYVSREIFLVYGSPLSGKTSYVESIMNPGDLILNIDNIWQCVSGLDRYIKPPKLNAVVFGIRDHMFDMIKMKIGKWDHAYIIGGYPLISERERICKLLGAREIYIESTKDECIKKLENIKDNRDKKEWKKYITDWWDKYRPPTLNSDPP